MSKLALGTVGLGMQYGLSSFDPYHASTHRDESLKIIRQAYDEGIRFFDTAPTYGDAEKLIGVALAGINDATISSKVALNPSDFLGGNRIAKELIHSSLKKSLKELNRDKLDVLKIHNSSIELLKIEKLNEIFKPFVEDGIIGELGASIYTEEEALIALELGWIRIVQVPYNLLDQRMSSKVFHLARSSGVKLITRSAFLKGTLTPRVNSLPYQMRLLKSHVLSIQKTCKCSLQQLPEIALRFCISDPCVDYVLIGPTKRSELETALKSAEFGALDSDMLQVLYQQSLDEPRLIDPRLWPI